MGLTRNLPALPFPDRITDLARRIWSRSLSRAVNLEYRSALSTPGIFDTPFYASQAGMAPQLDSCIDHYLKRGAAAGLRANRLFDGEAYLNRNPDVAKAGIDPFLHFIVFGTVEGRRSSVPRDCLAHLSAIAPEDLSGRRILEQARVLGWIQDRPTVWIGKTVAVYASSLGNFFFRHIADRIADGLRASGGRVYRLDQNSSRPPDVAVDFFVAPHEFFHLGCGVRWQTHPAIADSVMLNTEQPGSSWYFLGLRYANAAATLIDLSPQSAFLLNQSGRDRTGYFPIGFVPPGLPECRPMMDSLGHHREIELRAGIRFDWSSSTAEWRDRPIDVLFLGTLTPRRSEALASLASTLSRYRSFIHAPTGLGRPLSGAKPAIGTEESLALGRNAKVLLNIHRDEFSYLEWHRIMMIGIEQGALVLSEPCFPSPGLEAGKHFLEAPVEEMPARLSRILESADGDRIASTARTLGNDELRVRFDLVSELSALAFLHSRGVSSRA